MPNSPVTWKMTQLTNAVDSINTSVTKARDRLKQYINVSGAPDSITEDRRQIIEQLEQLNDVLAILQSEAAQDHRYNRPSPTSSDRTKEAWLKYGRLLKDMTHLRERH